MKEKSGNYEDEDLTGKFRRAIFHITEDMKDLERSHLILQFTRIFHKYFENDQEERQRIKITEDVTNFLLNSSINISDEDLIIGLFNLLPNEIQEEIGTFAAIKNMKIFDYISGGKFE